MDVIAPPATMMALAGRLLLATAVGAAVGLNRELQRKPAGLRTHSLVALGAALMTIIGLLVGGVDDGTGGAAASRVLQGIIAGVGFIGGGVILHRGDAKGVHGLTTAAAIWVVASSGIAIGSGMWRTGLIVAAVTLIVLTGGEYVDRVLHARGARR